MLQLDIITLAFHHTLQCSSIYRFNQIFNFHICHSLLFHSLKSMSHIPSPIPWGTLLLLLSGDVEINTGTQQIDQNPVFSSICSNKIAWGIQQDTAPRHATSESRDFCSKVHVGILRRCYRNSDTAHHRLIFHILPCLLVCGPPSKFPCLF